MEDQRSSSHSDGSATESSPLFGRSYTYWSPVEEGVTLSWRDLSVYVLLKQKGQPYKRIINNVSGAVRAGSLVALMGSSGAGKTSLMTALAYRTADHTVVEGDVLVNGQPMGDYMRDISGFMHQVDLFIDHLTVSEHLHIMARLRLDRRTTSQERKQRVLEIMRNLSLLKCRRSKISTISGGEKKRLSFASELLTDPPLLFCDEPTTGLDSYSAQKLIAMMNLMASSGKTIVCTIHQPSSQIFKMFSQVILLASGRLAYMGATSNAAEFFESLGYRIPANYNPADFYIRTLAVLPVSEDSCKQAIKTICDHFAVSDFAKEIDVIVQYEFHMARTMQIPTLFTKSRSFRKGPFCWTKLTWLTYRYLLEIVRKPTTHLLRILHKMGLAVVIALCFVGTINLNQGGIQATQGILFTLVTENTFTPMYSVLEMFPLDRLLFLREYKSGLYSPWTYYMSKLLAMLPGLIMDPILFVSVAYTIAGLRQDLHSFSLTLLVTIITMNVATACGLMFSNAFESVPSAFSVLVPFDYILMITSGIFIKLSTLPVILSWTKYISWLMYSMESLSIIQWNGVHNVVNI
ncbi:protein scarlet isoform X2 [Agrilus planipennis]|uniref:Protein scarlet isoform X2 n=1 Tax=Agrilus planipennis TaxID=224129 RepID=A0A1W4WFG3_AGRPL|nr:protein scarlet isoform X2 [Agrilus planipennis]